jgi:O-acetyl-ADP-ribose deacetylase (regulator of RNase III)
MPFEIIRQDITKMKVDAIVNSTSIEPIVGGSTDRKIHQAAGPKLIEERKKYGFLKISEAILTEGYLLPAKHVIHTVGPIYRGGNQGEAEQLKQAYLNCLKLAQKHALSSIAFTLISSGTLGYPKDQALDVAIDAIKTFLANQEMMIYLVVFDDTSFKLSKERVKHVESYLSEHYAFGERYRNAGFEDRHVMYNAFEVDRLVIGSKRNISDVIEELDETFTQKLFRFIKDKNLNETDVYKNANMSRQHFSKIRSDDHYQPKKETVMGLAIAMRLSLDETKDLLASAGYAISPSMKFDIICQYHIENEIYDLYQVNLMLYHYEQKLIGAES